MKTRRFAVRGWLRQVFNLTYRLAKIRMKAANDSEQTSQFVNRLRRRVVI